MIGRTSIIIAHRLSTIRKADRILVIRDGEIIESGDHITLANQKNGLYRNLLELQFQTTE
jgi:ABC-type multidrug transport system fused ATPase/permease subunit